ncbi:MAG: PAS domain S-box protein [Acetobacteraceae bacterium]|nr:PAS domain S-box protein [Acetobacteraceae bacterium]
MFGPPHDLLVGRPPGDSWSGQAGCAGNSSAEVAALAAELTALREVLAQREQALAIQARRLQAATERLEQRIARLEESEGQFRTAFDRSVIGMAQADPQSLRLLRVNERFCRITGYTEAELLGGMTLSDLVHFENRTRPPSCCQATDGEAGSIETRCMRKDGSFIHVQLDCVMTEPVPGRPVRLYAVLQDITERRATAERQALLAREVDHRAKNLLSVMQSIIRLTSAPDLQSYKQAIEGRISAVARAHSLLAAERWRHAKLRRLVREELAPYDAAAKRVRLSGPELLLLPGAVQALAMVLHELATNAAKYGALSVPGGSLSLGWEVAESEGLLYLRWQEQGGPPVQAPTAARRGFGSRVIAATIEEQLGGRIAMAWDPAGLRCDIAIPLSRVIPGRRRPLPP